jgi:hypothetical protein
MRAPNARRREADKWDFAPIVRKPRHFRGRVWADAHEDFSGIRLDAGIRGGTKKATFMRRCEGSILEGAARGRIFLVR